MRVYIDTSVFGGYFDKEFAIVTEKFFHYLFSGKISGLISDTLVQELIHSPVNVQDLLQKTINAGCERVPATEDAEYLRDAYIASHIVSERYANNALHVANATLFRADVIVSWNFKHLVNPANERAFNGVNIASGYGLITIMTPSDVVKIVEVQNEGTETEKEV